MKESSSSQSLDSIFFIFLSFLLGFGLTIMPLPEWSEWYRPPWLLLVLAYWLIRNPYRFNVGIAFCLGLILDVSNGMLLGEHALGFTVIAYLVAKFQPRLKLFLLIQQTACICLFVFIYQAIIFMIQGVLGQLPTTILYWLPTLTTLVAWPIVDFLLQGWGSRR